MKEDKIIFLPDTTIKLKTLKEKLSNLYGLEIITKKEFLNLKKQYDKGGNIQSWEYTIGGL